MKKHRYAPYIHPDCWLTHWRWRKGKVGETGQFVSYFSLEGFLSSWNRDRQESSVRVDAKEPVRHIQPKQSLWEDPTVVVAWTEAEKRGIGNREARQGRETSCSNYCSLCVIGNIIWPIEAAPQLRNNQIIWRDWQHLDSPAWGKVCACPKKKEYLMMKGFRGLVSLTEDRLPEDWSIPNNRK